MRIVVKKLSVKIALLIFIALAMAYLISNDFTQYLTLDYLKTHQMHFATYYENHQLFTISLYFCLYVLVTMLSLPGAAVMTLAGGALFGVGVGTLLVSFASTVGATLAFLLSRLVLRDFVQSKFGKYLGSFNAGLEKEGALYLFTLRLIPLFPFFVINLVMGLSKIKTSTFYLVSQLGMLPGTVIYVNAGGQLASIDSLSGILSPRVVGSLVLLGLFPLIAKKIISIIKAKKVYRRFSRPKKFDYDMVAIGGGSAGLVSAYICATLKAKVALIEKHKMGGDCLNTGCVPSKALIKSASVAHQMRRADKYGLKPVEVDFDFKKVMQRVQNVIKKIEPHDSIERYTNLGVDCLTGTAKILSPWEIEINSKVITTKNITIATGAKPFVPPLKGIEQVSILTSDNLWQLTELPQKMIILGGGPVGCEMAQSFSRLGSQVTQVEMGEQILAAEDLEVAQIVQQKFESEGVEVLTYHQAVEIQVREDKKFLIIDHHGEKVEREFDQILFAVGRSANVTGFGLEELGVKLRANKTIEANEFLQTNFPNIYVAGDVTGPYQLTHTASHQAWFCAVNALFGKFKKFKVDYSVIPWATYTDPEVATVGLNEKQAKKAGIPYDLTVYGVDDLDRAIADSEDHGIVRVLTKPGSDIILGATIVANHASDLMLEFIAAMKHGFGLNKILGTIHIYPTMGEANKFLAGNWKRTQTSPKVFQWLERYHRWMR